MFAVARRGALALGPLTAGLLALSPTPAMAGPATACPAGAKADFSRVQLYKDPDCRGASVIVGRTGDPNRADFARFRNFDGSLRAVDDNRSSLAIDRGTCVRLFDGKGYTGLASTNICARDGVVLWNLDRFDDRASSMRVCAITAQAACNAPAPPARPAPPAPPVPPAGGTIQDKAVAWALSKVGTKECQGEQPQWVRSNGFTPCSTNWCGIFLREAYRTGAGVDLGRIAYTEDIYNNARAGRNRQFQVPITQIRKGDLVLMYTYPKEGRRVTHVGMARGNYANGVIPTVEGNTGGDQVVLKTRSTSSVVSGRKLVVMGVRIR